MDNGEWGMETWKQTADTSLAYFVGKNEQK